MNPGFRGRLLSSAGFVVFGGLSEGRTAGFLRNPNWLTDKTLGFVVDELDSERRACLLEELGARGNSGLWVEFAGQAETGDHVQPLD